MASGILQADMPGHSMTFALPTDCPVKWTTAQDSSIKRDFPFADVVEESLQERVIRIYLQFLWLPESLMPLSHLVPTLLGLAPLAPSSALSPHPHPLHAVLEPILLTVRTCGHKYHHDIPEILAHGSEAAEDEPQVEESMIWYAFTHEKLDEEGATAERSAQADFEERWRKRWLARIERRETRIQILLYFLRLSLPGPVPAPVASPSKADASPRKKRKRSAVPPPATPTPEERLESFMDKLSTWQLVETLEASLSSQVAAREKGAAGQDWMQTFCVHMVEPLFKASLPTLCGLFRSKVFPHSPFAADREGDPSESSPSGSRSSSPRFGLSDDEPEGANGTSSRAASLMPKSATTSRRPSPALSTASSSRHPPQPGADARGPRARSLSVSLAEERTLKRTGSIGPGALPGKRMLSREVSMSRVFKDRDRAPPSGEKGAEDGVTAVKRGKAGGAKREREMAARAAREGVTLVAGTPVKSGVVLVGATPTKGKGD